MLLTITYRNEGRKKCEKREKGCARASAHLRAMVRGGSVIENLFGDLNRGELEEGSRSLRQMRH